MLLIFTSLFFLFISGSLSWIQLQCLFVFFLFFLSSPTLTGLIITHYSSFCFPSSQLTSVAFWESLNGLTEQQPPASALPAICRQDLPVPLKQKRRSSVQKAKNTTSALHQDWNINLLQKRYRESEAYSNLMQEKTAIWLGSVYLKRGEGRDLFFLTLHL